MSERVQVIGVLILRLVFWYVGLQLTIWVYGMVAARTGINLLGCS